LGELNPTVKRSAENLGVLRQMAQVLVGRDPRRIEQLVAEFKPAELDRIGFRVLSALEQALWDLLGKSLQTPVHALLGGACRDDIRIYANINRANREDRSPEAYASKAAAAVRDGFDAIKVGVFDDLPRGIDHATDAQAGIDRLRAVREAIGPNVELLVDCHSHFTVAGALEVAEELQDVGLFWFEEPIPQDDYDGYLQVMAACGLPVAGGESRMHRRGWWDVLDRQALDIVMPDVTIVGGIGELSKVAGMAAARGIPTAPHGPFGPVTTAASVHAMAAHPEFLILEYAWGEAPWRADLFLPAETIVNGRIPVSQRPGLGLELNPEVLAAHAVES
jgi:galactonate dehydratase